MITVITSVYVLKENKLLMVQEAMEHCKGMWNFPAGHLDEQESIFEAAIREAKEETGYDVKLIGLLGIQNCVGGEKEKHRIHFGFAAEIIGGEMSFNPKEIMSVQFVPVERVLKMTDKELRGSERKENVERLVQGKLLPLDIISNYNNKSKLGE